LVWPEWEAHFGSSADIRVGKYSGFDMAICGMAREEKLAVPCAKLFPMGEQDGEVAVQDSDMFVIH